METYFEAQPSLVKESAIALGFFDGVHPGHQAVIGKAREEATRLGVPCGVVTFKDHPRTLTRGQSPLLLTMIDQRLALFEQIGVDVALVLSFTEELCRLSPTEYVETMLVGTMGARSISVGPNHHFGRDREGDASLLSTLGKKNNFAVHVAEMVNVEGHEVSSSAIREALTQSNLERAALLLSRPYALAGEVITGDRRGRTLGFPTANLSIYRFQQIPARGVYVGKAKLDQTSFPCVINVGMRPTFHANGEGGPNDGLTVEAHLLDFEQDIYGKHIEIEFLSFLRSEQKFAGADSLKEQINLDIAKARQYLKEHGHQPSSQNEPDKLHA
ncbi:MAG: bifunctional riboflavin kinase/FAD synthetase [Candidatus Obscuribacterales bacterium]|nr:bifunctional riboflavin kinase/FAD synthetase [Candidatus Obscuribacterales bacterium]